MARAIGDLVEVKNPANEWKWAIIIGPQVAHSPGIMMYRYWNINGYGYTDIIRDFTGSDSERNDYLDQWEEEQKRLAVKGGSRKRSRRYRRNKRKNRKTRR